MSKGDKDMSLFLGPIHYWLYNKIGNQERLTSVIAAKAKEKDWIADADSYTKELPDLETAIDERNIHGWLQEQITDAESRFASLVIEIKKQGINLEELESIAFDFGKENLPDLKADASEIYRHFEDFFVNGMPCDHINIVTDESENQLSWEMDQDIHGHYWTGGDVADYYKLRKAGMDGMLAELAYVGEASDLYHYTIRRR